MKILDEITQAMIDRDKEQGHVGDEADIQWGRYGVLARESLVTLKRLCPNIATARLIDIIKGRI